jgi:hypothetical protein
MGVSTSLIAAAFVDWVTEHNLIRALIIGGAGIIGFLVTHFLTKKSAIPAPSASQNLKQEANPHINVQTSPQFNISVGNSPASAAPAPAAEKKPEPCCNIRFKDVKLGTSNTAHRFPFTPDFIFSAAEFENEPLPSGYDLRIPRVKARIIYRHPDGFDVLDLSNATWIPGTAKKYEKFEVNTPKYLLLFSLQNGKLRCRSAEPVGTRIAGRFRRITDYQDFDIALRVGSTEIQLLTDSEVLYRVLLTFDDGGDGLPLFTGFREL